MDLNGDQENNSLLSESLRNLLYLLPQLVSYIGQDSCFKLVSESYRTVFGVDPQSLIGRKPQDLLGEELYQKIAGEHQAALAGHRQDYEVEIPTDGGNVKTFHVRYEPHFDGDAVLGFLSVIEDITERKKRQKLLHLSEERYKAIVRAQTETISRFKADGTLMFANSQLCRVFGLREEHIIGTKWQPLVYEEDLPIVEKQLQSMSPENPDITIENRVYDGDGNVRWMQFANHGFFNENGELIEIQCVGRDITAIKKKKRQLFERTKELQEKTEELEKVNIALEFLLKRRDQQLAAQQERIHDAYSKLILPELYELESRVMSSRDKELISLIMRNFTEIFSQYDTPITSSKYNLTKTERRIAKLIRSTLSSQQIAEQLGISINTVNYHRKNLRRKFGLLHTKQGIADFLSGTENTPASD